MNALERHCREIDRCNQRGGRMLSVVDLLDAGTLTLELAAYLCAAISRGASFMVGALPGGAGKTTLMGALLNFAPRDMELHAADSWQVLQEGLKPETRQSCYICHEIGPGDYYAYLWGEDLREYFKLAEAGHMLATNLHADTFDQACHQVCGQNGVPAARFRRMSLLLFLRVTGGWTGRREISQVWESDGAVEHRLVYPLKAGQPANRSGLALEQSRIVDEKQYQQAAALLAQLKSSQARTIDQVRAFLTASSL